MSHAKPTREELQAGADAALAALETLPKDPPATPPAVETPVTPVVTPPETPAPVAPIAPVVPPEGEGTPPTPPVQGVDYEKKFKESSREAQRLASTNKEVNTAIQDAAALPAPTEEEMQTAYPEWAEMTPTEQRLAKDNVQNMKRFDLIHTATSKSRQQDEWVERVDTWVTDPKVLIDHPDLEGKQDEFKSFATEKERRGNDLSTLVLAFKAFVETNRPAPKVGGMFPTGNGGGAAPIAKVDDGKISIEESRQIMKSDYPKYVQLLKDGKVREE